MKRPLFPCLIGLALGEAAAISFGFKGGLFPALLFLLTGCLTLLWRKKQSFFCLWIFSAASLLDETINSTFPQISNLDFYMNCVAELCGDGDSENISIDVKTLTPEYITVPALQSVIWMVVTVIVLPLVVLISGFVVWFRRRKK